MQRKSRVTISVRYFFLSRMIRWTFKITKLVSLCAIFIISSQPFDFSNNWFILRLIIPCKNQEWILTLSRRDTGLFVSLLAGARFFPYKSFLSSLQHSVMFPFKFTFFLYFRISFFFTTLTIRKHLLYSAIIFVWFGHYHDLWQSNSQLLWKC